jgi:alkylhydroperoxidase family enzyme
VKSISWLALSQAAIAAFVLGIAGTAPAQDDEPRMIAAPDRKAGEGEGPYERLIIRGATLIDGTGAPPIGPVDIVIEDNVIREVKSVGYPGLPIDEEERPQDASREIDAHGSYVMPGIIDMHTHTGGATKAREAEYTYKLWMGHGITTVRGVPSGELEFSLAEKSRSARNEIVAPRIFSYHTLGSGEKYEDADIQTPEAAREWVRYIADAGADGLKLGSHRPVIMQALLDEAKKYGLGSTAHLGQMGVAQMNAQDAARLGLETLTHYYGLFESLYENHDVQPWPVDMNYNNEQHRFGQVARQWNLIAGRGSEKWLALLREFRESDFTLDPTFSIYSAGRDVMRIRNADWHRKYTLPTQWDFYTPNRESHGALAQPIVEIVHRVVTDAGRLKESWVRSMMTSGVTEERYVEIVGIVALVTALDTFDHALGRAVRPLPPSSPGEPRKVRPAGAKRDLAWVHTVAPQDLTPDDPDPYAVHGEKNIHRALSLVPQEVFNFFDLDIELYLKDDEIRAFGTKHRALTHAQIEMLAARVSALNGCYY